jgi:hypothetical protein
MNNKQWRISNENMENIIVISVKWYEHGKIM